MADLLSEPDHAGIFLSFFYRLRGRGLKVTPQQWLTVVEGLARGLHGSSLVGNAEVSRRGSQEMMGALRRGLRS